MLASLIGWPGIHPGLAVSLSERPERRKRTSVFII